MLKHKNRWTPRAQCLRWEPHSPSLKGSQRPMSIWKLTKPTPPLPLSLLATMPPPKPFPLTAPLYCFVFPVSLENITLVTTHCYLLLLDSTAH